MSVLGILSPGRCASEPSFGALDLLRCCSMLLFGQYEVLDVLAEQPTALRIRGKDAEVEHLTRLSVRNLEDFRRIYAHGRSNGL